MNLQPDVAKYDLLVNSKTSAVLKYYSIIYFKYGELRRK
jgi:hypothetical protein